MFRRVARLTLALALPSLALSPLALTGVLASSEFPEFPDDPSAFVTVINARDYDDRFETVEDVLSHVAGVRVSRFGPLGAHSTASIRGAKSEQVLVLLDGMRLNSANRGAVDLSTLDLRSVEKIDVVRGAGSARYGSDAMGGVISITTRRADDGQQADASFLTGSQQTLGGDLFVSHGGEKLRVSGSYQRRRSENDFRFQRPPGQGGVLGLVPDTRHTRLNADFVEDGGLLKLGYDFGPNRDVELSWNGYRKDRGQPGSTLGKPVFNVADEQLSCTSTDQQFGRWLGGLRWRDRGLAEGSLEASLSHRWERDQLSDPDRCLFALAGTQTDFQTVENQSTGELRWASRRRRYGPVSMTTRASGTARLDRVRPNEGDSQRRYVGSLFAQQDLHLFGGALRIIPALGFEAANTSDGEARASEFQGFEKIDVDDDSVWLPRLGAIWRIAPGLRLKTNYLRAYRRPNFTELFHPDQGFIRGNPRLDSEDSWNFDIGLEAARERWGPLSRLRAEAAWFRRDIDDSIEWTLVGTTMQPVNTGRAEAKGVEASVSLLLFERLSLAGSYTWLDTEVDATGAPLPHSPSLTLSGRVGLPIGPFRVFSDYRYEDDFTLNSSTLPYTAPDSHQLDVGVTLFPQRLPGLRSLPESLSVTSEWLNVTAQARVDSLGLPLPDQTLWYLTLRVALQ